jgi:hypothetical protein
MLKLARFEGISIAVAQSGVTLKGTTAEIVQLIYNACFSAGIVIEEEEICEYLAAHPELGPVVRGELGFFRQEGVIPWPKPVPSSYALFVATWGEEFFKLKAAANKMSLVAAQLDNEHSIGLARICVFEALGLGGVLEFQDGRLPPADDKAMSFCLEAVSATLRVVRPEWFDPTGQIYTNPNQVEGSTDSLEFQQFVEDCKTVLHKRQKAAESAAARRKARIADIKKARAELFTHLAPLRSADLDAFEKELEGMSFDKLKEEVQDVGAVRLSDTCTLTTWIPRRAFGNITFTQDEVPHVEDWLLRSVVALHPDWFTESEDGSYRLKRAIPKERRRGMDRLTRSLHKALDKLIQKHGSDKVVAGLEAVMSVAPATDLSPGK